MSLAADGAIDKISFGTWSVAKLFVNPSISANTQVTHKAHLVETKNCKHTYVVENGQNYFGSLTEQVTSSHFNNVLIIPGKNPLSGSNTNIPTKSTPNYSSADKKAYYSYVGSGYVETINGYTYGGAYYNSVTS